MSNTIKTLQAGDITRKALAILHNKLVFCKTINREYDGRFAVSGAKNGGYLEIREPNQFTVRTGAVMDTQDVTESTTQLVVATQKGIDINFSSVELTLSMDDFASRILEPAMSRLAADVDATVIAGCYPYIYNFENTTLGTKPVLADILAARALISKGLAPTSDRVIMLDSLAANSVITDGKSLFHASSEIERQYSEGQIGRMGGFTFYESEMTPTHTTGSRTDTTPTVSTTVGITSGDATITMSGVISGETYMAGDIFTIAGVYAVNPETKARYGHLQQFSVTETVTVSGTSDTFEVSPIPITSGAKQNVEIVTGSATASVTNLAHGAASTSYINSLAYHKDAFTMVTADLEMPDSGWYARKVIDGISMRIWRQGDIVNDKHPCRIDVLFGYKAIRPEWACRICS